MSEFNLVDEPWIPVRMLDGSRTEMGIRETLLRSDEIEEIEDQSPLVVAALHRLLLAVLYRAVRGPTSIEQSKALFAEFPSAKISEYLDRWHHRFWLFDATAPFWQVPDFEPSQWRAWTALAAEHNADTAKVLFDHLGVESAGSISRAAAARWIAAAQTFSVGTGNSELAYTSGAPSATAVMVLPLGACLRDTLLLSLVWQPASIIEGDLPVWEQKPRSVSELKPAPSRPPFGNADLYTWQTRAILLRADGPNVSRLAFASGVKCQNERPVRDPMVPYRKDKNRGVLPLQFRERGLWRDFDALLPDGDTDLAPAVMEHASSITRYKPPRRPRSVLVLGQAADKAKILFWRRERFSLPQVIANATVPREALRQLLDAAEGSHNALWQACNAFARDVLSHGGRDPQSADRKDFVQQMPVASRYWSLMETRFHELLQSYAAQLESEEIQAIWYEAIHDALRDAWNSHAATVAAGDAWSLRALVRAEGAVRKEMHRIGELLKELKEEGIAA